MAFQENKKTHWFVGQNVSWADFEPRANPKPKKKKPPKVKSEIASVTDRAYKPKYKTYPSKRAKVQDEMVYERSPSRGTSSRGLGSIMHTTSYKSYMIE
jgi:hypothetical protein